MTIHRIVIQDGEEKETREVKSGYKERVFLNVVDPGAFGAEHTKPGTIEIGSESLLRFVPDSQPSNPEIYVKKDINSMMENQGMEGSISTAHLLDGLVTTPKTIKFVWSEKER